MLSERDRGRIIEEKVRLRERKKERREEEKKKEKEVEKTTRVVFLFIPPYLAVCAAAVPIPVKYPRGVGTASNAASLRRR